MIKRGKKAQGSSIGISFSTIFSIILIIFFLVIAFMVVRSFLKTRDCAKVGLFSDDFKETIDRAWNSQSDDYEFKSTLPTNVEFVCFANLSKSLRGDYENIGLDLSVYEGMESNLFLYPIGSACNMEMYEIKHLDIEFITRSSNPFCVPVEDGVVRMRIIKLFNEGLVKIREPKNQEIS
ncbi:hypothetical protein GF386_00160 [Candidatus Pacearchaeota archaeon]|nr:hypothetical protein [Candidatus Pacearchaeota archaeon]MBD3282695.1 hypothetical protein [Candidatus Pacearchaeota archaeon]